MSSFGVTFFVFLVLYFFFNDTATTEIYTLSLHDALPIYRSAHKFEQICRHRLRRQNVGYSNFSQPQSHLSFWRRNLDRKSGSAGMPRPISYAVFCLKKKKHTNNEGDKGNSKQMESATRRE